LELSMQIKQIVTAVSVALISAPLFAADPAQYPVAQPTVAAPATSAAFPYGQLQPLTPEQAAKNSEEWVRRMSDFTLNASAFKDPARFNAWLNAMTDPSIVGETAIQMIEPGNWLRMMTSMMQPATVANYTQFLDPMVTARWTGAMINPAFYLGALSNFADPSKAMRWVMLPMDPKLMRAGAQLLDPNLYFRWMMMPTDPRGMALMFAPMNPQLYGSMMGGLFNAKAFGPTWDTFMNPVQPVVALQPHAPVSLPINLLDPSSYGNALSILGLPSLSTLTAPGQAGAAPSFPFPFPLPVPGATSPYAPAAPAAAPTAKAAAPAAPAQVVAKAAVPAQPAAFVIKAGAPAKMTLGGDTLFKTSKSSIKDLSPEGRLNLDQLVSNIKAFGAIDSIRVTGYADKTGKAAANQKLSVARAKTVVAYLKSKGVKAASFTAAGMGDSKPVVDCDMNQPKEALKACLAPNRRVEVEVTGAKK
jgi:outer membrane protein OmpA-like peptidoglycan-associated protein